MATSTLLQWLEPGTPTASSRAQEETFRVHLAGGSGSLSITKGDWLSIDGTSGLTTGLYVVKAAGVGTVGNTNVIGVALEDLSLADPGAGKTVEGTIRACIAGYCKVANVDGATAAGSALIGPIGTAGRSAVENPGTTTGSVIGVALAADVSNFAPVVVFKRF